MSIANKDHDIRHRQRMENSITGANHRFRHSAVHIANMSPLIFETSFSVGKLFHDFTNKNIKIEKKAVRIIDSRQLYREVTAIEGNLPNRLVLKRDDKMLVDVTASSPAQAVNNSIFFAGYKS